MQQKLQKEYDVLVIGSGPGGQRAAVQAAKLGKRALVVEKDLLGGSCLHWGTIPSKTLREAVLKCEGNSCDLKLLQDVLKQTRKVIAEEQDLIQRQFARNKVEWVNAVAEFQDEHTVRLINPKNSSVTLATVKAQKIILATGTRPNHPKEVLVDGNQVFDSDSILSLSRCPQTLTVMGAGVIGCEYASIFARMGIRVTLIDRRTGLLRGIDTELNQMLTRHFETSNIHCVLGAQFSDFEILPHNSGVSFTLNGQKVQTDSLIICMGRVGNFESLKLENCGLKANDRGLLCVNENYQTEKEHIYAVGDIIGSPALAASSEEQGRLASAHAFGLKRGKFPSWFPYGIYTIPEVSMVGPVEEELKSSGKNYVVGRAFYKELARGKILGDNDGILKIFVEKETRKLLSVHCLGTQATELVHIGQVAIAFGATIDFLVDNVFNYPTLAEAYKVAAYNAYNQLN